MTEERPLGRPPLDRRIERLEREFTRFETNVALIQAEQSHMRELITTRFAEGATTMTRIESTLATLTTSVTASATDAAASPVGRSFSAEIREVAADAREAKLIAERVERRLLFAAGGLAMLVWAAGIFGPTIAKLAFGLST